MQGLIRSQDVAKMLARLLTNVAMQPRVMWCGMYAAPSCSDCGIVSTWECHGGGHLSKEDAASEGNCQQHREVKRLAFSPDVATMTAPWLHEHALSCASQRVWGGAATVEAAGVGGRSMYGCLPGVGEQRQSGVFVLWCPA
jgi:hypothetical protein